MNEISNHKIVNNNNNKQSINKKPRNKQINLKQSLINNSNLDRTSLPLEHNSTKTTEDDDETEECETDMKYEYFMSKRGMAISIDRYHEFGSDPNISDSQTGSIPSIPSLSTKTSIGVTRATRSNYLIDSKNQDFEDDYEDHFTDGTEDTEDTGDNSNPYIEYRPIKSNPRKSTIRS